jgi:hypothetical protein
MANATKIGWRKPELRILTKGTAQESVLWFCKFNQQGDGPRNQWLGCFNFNASCAYGSQS